MCDISNVRFKNEATRCNMKCFQNLFTVNDFRLLIGEDSRKQKFVCLVVLCVMWSALRLTEFPS